MRAAGRDDARAIHDLHTRCLRALWPSHYSIAQIEGWMSGRTPDGYLPAIGRGEMFVAEDDSGLLGFGHAAPGAIKAVYVEPERAGTGVGAAILHHAIARASAGSPTEITLTSTLNAEGFYARFGFEPVERKSIAKGDISLPVVLMRLRCPDCSGGVLIRPRLS
jgi:putative acetyltransferase